MRAILILMVAVCGFRAGAQELAGRIIDDKKEPLSSAIIIVEQGGVIKGGAATDYDGNYVVKPLEPGNYNAIIAKSGYDTIVVTNVMVEYNQRSFINKMLSPIVGVPKKELVPYDKPKWADHRRIHDIDLTQPLKISADPIDSAK